MGSTSVEGTTARCAGERRICSFSANFACSFACVLAVWGTIPSANSLPCSLCWEETNASWFNRAILRYFWRRRKFKRKWCKICRSLERRHWQVTRCSLRKSGFLRIWPCKDKLWSSSSSLMNRRSSSLGSGRTNDLSKSLIWEYRLSLQKRVGKRLRLL